MNPLPQMLARFAINKMGNTLRAGPQLQMAPQTAPMSRMDIGGFPGGPERTPSFVNAPQYGQPTHWAQYLQGANTGSLRSPGKAAPMPPPRPAPEEPQATPQQNTSSEFFNPSGQNFTANSPVSNMGRFMRGEEAQAGMETPMDNLRTFLKGMFG